MARPLILFAPGAGAPSTSAWMRRWAERLAILGEVVSFDYPYQREGRRRPDPLPRLVAAHGEALASARATARRPTVLCGKSMGSRVGCHLALDEQVRRQARLAALICFGYPLVSRSGTRRDAVLCQLQTPVLFLQGSADPLCPLAELEAVRARMRAPSTLQVVDGGDHSLEVGVRALRQAGSSQEELERRLLGQIEAFLVRHLRGYAPAGGDECSR